MSQLVHPEITVGTIFCLDVGYTSRNPKFLKVVHRTNAQVVMKELRSIVVSHDGYMQNGTKIASDELVENAVEIKSRLKTNKYTNKPEIKVGYWSGYKWEGQGEAFYTD